MHCTHTIHMTRHFARSTCVPHTFCIVHGGSQGIDEPRYAHGDRDKLVHVQLTRGRVCIIGFEIYVQLTCGS